MTNEISQREYLRGDAFLPRPLRDFHDQKDVFKSLHEWIGEPDESAYIKTPDWAAGQCYVIDHFLKFMAAHGWTMQRSRAHVTFASLDATIKARRDREVSVLREGFARRDESTAAAPPEPEERTANE